LGLSGYEPLRHHLRAVFSLDFLLFSMEAAAALEMVKGLFENKEVRVSVTKMVIDDDASTHALTHSLSELARRVVDFQWPVDAKGKKIPVGKDVGKLPFEHPVIVFLADLMHRIRSFGKNMFGLGVGGIRAVDVGCNLKEANQSGRS
jgi:hypothetical protein